MKWLSAAFALAITTLPAFAEGPPEFQVDASWPKPLPNKWLMGQAAGIAVDAQDHVWIIQRPKSLTDDEKAASFNPPRAKCCVPAPPVMEFDADGKLLNAWGGPGQGYDWFENEHGISVDHKGNVWVGGNGNNDGHILKFSRDGKFLLQIGKPGAKLDSNDTAKLGRPADTEIDPATNEIYVADGYGNKRVIVFDADTGAYKRHWGAYGKPPSDEKLPAFDPKAPPPQQFANPVHCIRVAKDGFVYVCDRTNNRIQVFRKDGGFVKEFFVEKDTLLQGSMWWLRAVAGCQAELFDQCRWREQRSAHPVARKRRDARLIRPQRPAGRRLPLDSQSGDRQQRQHLYDRGGQREARSEIPLFGSAAEVIRSPQ